MKKALFLVGILLLSVVSTACINNFAVQELNNKAQQYMENGNYKEAIERLKSSIDLDGAIFESHYNLAVAYTQVEDYANATDEFEKAIKINPDNAETYYSLAVAQGNLVIDLQQGTIRLAEDGNFVKEDELKNDEETEGVYKPSEEVLQKISELKVAVVKNYNTYLEKAPDAKDKAEVQSKIKAIEQGDKTEK